MVTVNQKGTDAASGLGIGTAADEPLAGLRAAECDLLVARPEFLVANEFPITLSEMREAWAERRRRNSEDRKQYVAGGVFSKSPTRAGWLWLLGMRAKTAGSEKAFTSSPSRCTALVTYGVPE